MENAARENGLSSIAKIVLEIGQFSGVEVGALEFAFSVLTRGTILEDAEFEYLTPPLLLYCEDCKTEYLSDREDLCCPICEDSTFRIVRGQELLIKSLVGE